MSTALQQLTEEYNRLPKIDCKKKCLDSCSVVPMSLFEHDRINERIHNFSNYEGLTCPLLSKGGTCLVYDIRPIMCRLFGLTEKLRCPFGCVPEYFISDDTAYRILDRIMALSGGRARGNSKTADQMMELIKGHVK